MAVTRTCLCTARDALAGVRSWIALRMLSCRAQAEQQGKLAELKERELQMKEEEMKHRMRMEELAAEERARNAEAKERRREQERADRLEESQRQHIMFMKMMELVTGPGSS
jgi:hypothetical protein